MDVSGAQTQTNNEVEYSLQRHEWCSCNKCRRSSDDGTGKYIYFKTFHSHKHEYNKKRSKNKRDYPELEDKGYKQTVWLRRAVPHSGKRSRGNQNHANRDVIQGTGDGNENMPANVIPGSDNRETNSEELNQPDLHEYPDIQEDNGNPMYSGSNEDQRILDQILPNDTSDEEEELSDDCESDGSDLDDENDQDDQEQDYPEDDYTGDLEDRVEGYDVDIDKGKKILSLYEKFQGTDPTRFHLT